MKWDAALGKIQVELEMPNYQTNEITTECYENEIPHFVSTEMDRLYGSLFSSLLHFTASKKLTHNTNTYIAHQAGRLQTVLLFRIDSRRIKVLNELIEISGSEIHRFANYVFKTYKLVTSISFHAIRTDFQITSYPYQKFYCAEDIIISLPDTAPIYLRGLGKNTRRNIKRYNEAILRANPSYCYKILSNEEINEDLICHIIGLNKERMAGKNKISVFDDKETQWIIAIAAASGLVGIVTIDGRICAGSICCRIADNYYMLVIAHDSAYNDFSLGTLCCYQTICECIDRGGKELHFMWGRLDYKYTLQAVQRGYDQLDIYRTRADLFRNLNVVLKTALTGHIREAKFWLLDRERQHDIGSRAATKFLNFLRFSKQIATRIISK
jgi:hypothetical protein